MKTLLMIFLIWGFSINSWAQGALCINLFNAYEQKDTTSFRNQYKLHLKYDNCIIAIIDTIVLKIQKNSINLFELEALKIISDCSDGYASEYISTSMQNIFDENFDRFIYRAYLFDRMKPYESKAMMNIILESDTYIDFNLIERTKILAESVRKSNSDFYKYLDIIIKMLSN